MLLSLPELKNEIASRPGLIPVDIHPDSDRIEWLDLEQYHCYNGLFRDALDSWSALRVSAPARFQSSLDALDCLEIPCDSLAPTGFIFHAGRCGSTLLAQILARSRENIVFGEAAPHNRIWRSLEMAGRGGPESATRAFRNLVLLMGRRRLPSYRTHIIKFTSLNILQFERIRAAFPAVPALFLFREPGAILTSYRRAKPEWMEQEWQQLATAETAVEAFFRAALKIQDPHFRCLEYAAITPESLSSIVAFLGLKPSSKELSLMAGGFLWDAKSGNVPRPFTPGSPSPPPGESVLANLPAVLVDLYLQLRNRVPLFGVASDAVG